ncbi:MAG: DUF4350 domain-containing protein, partial [bacterium]
GLPVELRAQQMADPNFSTTIERPAYTRIHPRIVIDEAHLNFHTADGRYKPLAELLRSDGYEVVPGKEKFNKRSLGGVRLLVISNATGPGADDNQSASAFTEEECDAVAEWVRGGGSLLLIADHVPFGAAAASLGKRFGADMGNGVVFDSVHSEPGTPVPTGLVFSRENGLLGEHAIVRGRNASEEVKRVVAFTGQSLSVPRVATALMKLSPTAWEAPTFAETQAAWDAKSHEERKAHARPVGGRAQGIAMRFGKGRVVIMGEAAMFSAQIIRFIEGGQQQEFQMGMNVPGNNDRQFALNVMHWLSGALK